MMTAVHTSIDEVGQNIGTSVFQVERVYYEGFRRFLPRRGFSS